VILLENQLKPFTVWAAHWPGTCASVRTPRTELKHHWLLLQDKTTIGTKHHWVLLGLGPGTGMGITVSRDQAAVLHLMTGSMGRSAMCSRATAWTTSRNSRHLLVIWL